MIGERGDLGQLDGETPDLATVRLTGEAIVDRALMRGERLTLTCWAEVKAVSVRERNGAVVRIHSVTVETVAEPSGSLAEDVALLLTEADDTREGRMPLPLDEEGE